MLKSSALIAFSLILLASPAMADPVPDYVLDHDYVNCMGGETSQKDPQRDEYCKCVRDGMKGWDLDTYGTVATEESKSASKDTVPAKLGDIAKGCIAKILK